MVAENKMHQKVVCTAYLISRSLKKVIVCMKVFIAIIIRLKLKNKAPPDMSEKSKQGLSSDCDSG